MDTHDVMAFLKENYSIDVETESGGSLLERLFAFTVGRQEQREKRNTYV